MLNQFRQLIEKHFRLLRLPKEYAELMYITPNYLNALCQDVTGKSAGDLIRDRIILEAKRFLTNANMDISEISYELNFQDNSYFTRFFKKSTGITPEVFRKKMIQ
jgi:AraC-like DNA-binding protein